PARLSPVCDGAAAAAEGGNRDGEGSMTVQQFALDLQTPDALCSVLAAGRQLAARLADIPAQQRVHAINEIRSLIHEVSPFKEEPVDFVRWVQSEEVYANDYNPNTVAPPEMELLAHSILTDGYTQPIVTFPTEKGREVVDGFHRNRVGKENEQVSARIMGYLPVVAIKADQTGLNDRIAATIRHNRARGKHSVDAMSDIVVELKRRNWSDSRIAKELGMDPDEVLRLTQITGLAELFADQEFSKAWESDKEEGGMAEAISDLPGKDYKPKNGNRILHTWEKWECYHAGFYAERPPDGVSQDEGEEAYRGFLADLPSFEAALRQVISKWKHSCEHYLTNDRMNRIAWLGQAAAAHAIKMPSCCRGGYHRLTAEQQVDADAMALLYLNEWLEANGRQAVTMEQAGGRTDAELY
ncbi:MAG: ParB N-terminal domain-containing protein, partial [Aquiluna sp.]